MFSIQEEHLVNRTTPLKILTFDGIKKTALLFMFKFYRWHVCVDLRSGHAPFSTLSLTFPQLHFIQIISHVHTPSCTSFHLNILDNIQSIAFYSVIQFPYYPKVNESSLLHRIYSKK